ncbi:MAG: hypothetical protein NUV88_03565 [Candidatus Kaiserbacteria bacterium]|nr:hypothetical protein [Candidatus Kaiserbacteria bacterium]
MMNYAQSKYASRAGGKFGSGTFTPRKPVKTFRDLDIYQKAMECAVIVVKNIRPKLEKLKYPFIDGITDCTMSVPLFIGEAHSIRFGNFPLGLSLIEKAMSGCNKMIIYLEHIKGMYGDKADADGVLDEIVARYAETRTKTFHLEQSWKKWGTAPREITPAKIKL